MAIFELRQYTPFPGKLAELVRFMKDVVIPHIASKGVIAAGSFFSEAEEGDKYFWIWRYESQEERKQLQVAYADDYFMNDLLPIIKELMDIEKNVITCLQATPKSILR